MYIQKLLERLTNPLGKPLEIQYYPKLPNFPKLFYFCTVNTTKGREDSKSAKAVRRTYKKGMTTVMTLSEKLAARIAQSIIRGEIDPSMVKDIEKKVGVSLNLSEEQLAWATLVYANRQEYKN